MRLKEKLIIKNFGPIKDVELELGGFNILIGEQATGKSTIAKVLAICRDFSYIAPPLNSWDENFAKGLNSWGLSEFIKKEKTYISYECEHYFFKATSVARVDHNYDPVNETVDVIELPPGFETDLNYFSDAFKKYVKN